MTRATRRPSSRSVLASGGADELRSSSPLCPPARYARGPLRSLQGTVFDLPSVIQGTKEHLAQISERCTAIAGDFFTSVPGGASLYILSGVIHDWDDAQSIVILRNCRNAMLENSKILVVEMVVPESSEPSFSTLLDLNMLVMSGGRERTESQFRSLFKSADLQVTRVISTLAPLKIIEGRRA